MDFKELPQKIETEIFKLHKKRYRKETYKYIIEGIICINELLNAGIEPFYVVCSDEFINSEKSVDILSKLKKIKVPIYTISTKTFEKMVDTVSPQGIFCVAPMKFIPMETALKKQDSKILILDRMSDPGNLGTIIRSAAAFNFSGIFILSNSVELYNMKVIRSALGSHLHIPILYDIEANFVLDTLKEKEFKIFAAVPSDGEPYYSVLNKKDKIAIIIGNEHHGIDPEILKNDYIKKIRIPLNPKIESLNAAVSASVIMAFLQL